VKKNRRGNQKSTSKDMILNYLSFYVFFYTILQIFNNFSHIRKLSELSSDLPTDPLLAGHTRKNALLPAPDHDPQQVIVFTRKITHQKMMPNG
jgi:hypothetical protein